MAKIAASLKMSQNYTENYTFYVPCVIAHNILFVRLVPSVNCVWYAPPPRGKYKKYRKMEKK